VLLDQQDRTGNLAGSDFIADIVANTGKTLARKAARCRRKLAGARSTT
jgi:hypothetical protein